MAKAAEEREAALAAAKEAETDEEKAAAEKESKNDPANFDTLLKWIGEALADQVKEVWKAVKTKNQYFHDQIFRGVLLANAKSPAFKGVDAKDIPAKREELYQERMKRMPELDAAVRAALVMRPHTVAIERIEK